MPSKYYTVNDLDDAQFAQLKEVYFWELVNTGDADGIFGGEITCPEDIPDSAIINHYSEIVFTNDDFW